jgi:hypothetical protein
MARRVIDISVPLQNDQDLIPTALMADSWGFPNRVGEGSNGSMLEPPSSRRK